MGEFKTTTIEHVKDFIKNYYKSQCPVLIENLTKNWDAFNKWNLNYIQSLAGDQIVPLYNNKPTKETQKSAEPAEHMKRHDYIEIIKTHHALKIPN